MEYFNKPIKPGAIIPLREEAAKIFETDFAVVRKTDPGHTVKAYWIHDELKGFVYTPNELKPYGFRPKAKFQDLGDPVLYPTSNS